MHKLLSYLGLIILLTSCSSENTTIPNEADYKDFLREDNGMIEVDTAISSHEISVPAKQNVFTWKSSNFSLKGIPQNISFNTEVDKILFSSHKIYRGASEENNDRNVVISNNTILAVNKNMLYAHELSNPNKLKWKKEITQKDDHLLGGGIYATDGYATVTNGSKEIVLINILNGNKVWTHNLANLARSAPLIYRGSVFINTIDNTLHCIDLKTGFLKWSIKEAHENLGFLGSSTPEPFEDTIIIPFSSGKLSSVDINTGQIRWSASLSMGVSVQSYVNDIDMTPVIKDGVAYLSSHNGILYAIDATTGKLEWANTKAGGQNQVWVAGDYSYAINKHNQLLAIYKLTGTIKWIYDLEPQRKKKKKENIFFNEEHINFTGPTMINGNLYIVSSDGHLIIISAKTGKKIGETKITKNIYSPILAADNKLYLLDNSGNLHITTN